MPIEYSIIPEACRIIVTITDPFDGSNMDDFNAALFADPLFKTGFDVLADSKLSHYNMRASAIRLHASKAGEVNDKFSGRQAIVCHDNRLMYGLARMYALFSESFGITAKVFTTMAAAEKWLDDARNDKMGYEGLSKGIAGQRQTLLLLARPQSSAN